MPVTEKLIVLDRDGVINEDSTDYIKTADEWRPLPGSLDAIAALCDAGFRVIVVSDQSGIGRGLFSEADLTGIHRKMTEAAEAAGGEIAAIYYCPHHPDDECDCRKPRTGMLDRIATDLAVSLNGVPLVGDKAADMELARRAGARPILVLTGYGQETKISIGATGPETFADLAAVTCALLAERDA